MAAINSSSRRKSSSLMKKKRSKNSSEVRKRRRSRSRTRKSLKSKKVRRRDVSLSSSDDEDSRRDDDSVSATSSDSECDHRRGRARSRTRRKLKGSRKRGRSEGSSSDSPRRRKKKGLRRSLDSKKKQKKKRTSGRSRRDVSVDSASSDSWSCSTCRGDSIRSGESESERSRGRSEVRKKGKRTSGRTKDEKGRYSYGPRSISSCSACDNRSDYQSEEELPSLNDSRRLRSVITIESRNDETEERFVSKEEENADVIQAYDDCPSCRSNDSYEGLRKESSQQIVGASGRKWCPDDAIVTKDFSSDCIENKDDGVVDRGQIDSAGNAIQSTIEGFKGEVCTGPLEGENLELILRQKALENLRKFRGELINKKTTSDKKPKNDNDGEQSSAANVEVEQSEGASKKVAGAEQTVVDDAENVSLPMVDKSATTCLPNCNQTPSENGDKHRSEVKQDEGHPELDACNLSSHRINAVKAVISNKNSVTFESKSSQSTSVSKKESCGDHSNLKTMHSTHNSPDTQSSEAKNVTSINVPVTIHGNAVRTEADKVRMAAASDASSSLTPVTGQHGSKKPGDSTEGGSQYEQKTMSVMRGGELVQVSYKVYIPKKPPALARRQLKRSSDLQ